MIRLLAWAGTLLMSAFLGLAIVVGLGVILLVLETLWRG